MTLDLDLFKRAMAQFATGVTIVTSLHGETPIGITASAFVSLSLEPPLVLVCLRKDLFTHETVAGSGLFAVNVLAESQVDWAMRFAGMIPEFTEDRFTGIDTRTAVTGAPILPGVLSWVDCRLWAIYDGGDHSIFVGRVEAVAAPNSEGPLLYYDRVWGRHEMLEELVDED